MAIFAVVVVVVVAVVLVIIFSGCGSSSKILFWTGKYKLGVIAGVRVGKYNLGTRAFNAKFLPESVNTSSGQELVDTNWEPGPVAKQMAGGREMQRPFL